MWECAAARQPPIPRHEIMLDTTDPGVATKDSVNKVIATCMAKIGKQIEADVISTAERSFRMPFDTAFLSLIKCGNPCCSVLWNSPSWKMSYFAVKELLRRCKNLSHSAATTSAQNHPFHFVRVDIYPPMPEIVRDLVDKGLWRTTSLSYRRKLDNTGCDGIFVWAFVNPTLESIEIVVWTRRN